ncbi:unnamed protein product [Tenebrio molitor]|nr:unnamed protein product [Tenebrio molitor]
MLTVFDFKVVCCSFRVVFQKCVRYFFGINNMHNMKERNLCCNEQDMKDKYIFCYFLRSRE